MQGNCPNLCAIAPAPWWNFLICFRATPGGVQGQCQLMVAPSRALGIAREDASPLGISWAPWENFMAVTALSETDLMTAENPERAPCAQSRLCGEPGHGTGW